MIEYDSKGYNGCDGLERLMNEDHIVYVSSEYYILTSSPYDLDKQCQQVINRLFEVGTAETALKYPEYFAVLVPRPYIEPTLTEPDQNEPSQNEPALTEPDQNEPDQTEQIKLNQIKLNLDLFQNH